MIAGKVEIRNATRYESNIARILVFYVENISHIDVASHQLQSPADFKIELLLAGIDLDGQPKIGSLVIEVRQPFLALTPLMLVLETEVIENKIEVISGDFTWKTHGINVLAESYLKFPNTESRFPAVRTYAQARLNPHDKATSLTVADMENLGRDLIHATNLVSPYVGGDAQVAVLAEGKVQAVKQRQFRNLVAPYPLSVFSNFEFHERPGSMILAQASGTTALFDHVTFSAPPQTWTTIPDYLKLDNNIFIGCHFVNKVLTYNGGPFFIDETITWDNTDVVVLPGGEQNSTARIYLRNKAKASRHE